MNNLWKSNLFNLLSETSLVTNERIKNAYETFVKEVFTLNQPETDYQTIFRTLNIPRIEFQIEKPNNVY